MPTNNNQNNTINKNDKKQDKIVQQANPQAKPDGTENTVGDISPSQQQKEKYTDVQETIYEGKYGNYIKLGLFSAIAKYSTFSAGGGGIGNLGGGNPGDAESWIRGVELPKLKKSDAVSRAIQVARYLSANMQGFGNFGGAAYAGVFLDENSCDPFSCMKTEKAGGGSKYTQGPNNYGAGIASWTGHAKKTCLVDNGYDELTPIEQFDLQKQCQMLCVQFSKSWSKYANRMRNAVQKGFIYACASAYFNISGNYLNAPQDPCPEPQAAFDNSEYAQNSNAKRFHGGNRNVSSYMRDNSFSRRVGYACAILKQM